MAVSLLRMRAQMAHGVKVRTATSSEAQAIRAMQHLSLRTLGRAHYTDVQIESYLRYTTTLEEYLLADETYFVACTGSDIVGCGGWSERIPAYDAATTAQPDSQSHALPKVRAMFVHPDFARRGVGRSVLEVIEGAMISAGHREARVDSTLGGIALYERNGYGRVHLFHAELPNGTKFPLLRMYKRLSSSRQEEG